VLSVEAGTAGSKAGRRVIPSNAGESERQAFEALAGECISSGGKEFFITTRKGYTVVAWRDEPANIVCSIVADLGHE
jgi:hypothetical protein